MGRSRHSMTSRSSALARARAIVSSPRSCRARTTRTASGPPCRRPDSPPAAYIHMALIDVRRMRNGPPSHPGRTIRGPPVPARTRRASAPGARKSGQAQALGHASRSPRRSATKPVPRRVDPRDGHPVSPHRRSPGQVSPGTRRDAPRDSAVASPSLSRCRAELSGRRPVSGRIPRRQASPSRAGNETRHVPDRPTSRAPR